MNERSATIWPSSPQQKRAWYFQKRVIIPALVLILAGVGFLLYWLFFLRGFVATDDAFIDGNRIEIGAKILGRITRLTSDEGFAVKAGDPLVFLDSADLVAQRSHAQANLALAVRNAERARIILRYQKIEYNRAAEEYRREVIPLEQYQQAQKALKTVQSELSIDEAQIAATRAQLKLVLTQLDNVIICAPVDGIVAKRWASAGDVVQPAQQIFTLYDTSDIWVSVNLEETKFAPVHLRSPADIRVDAYPGEPFSGLVTMIGASTASEFSLIPPNNATGNFTKVTQRVPLRTSIRHRKTAGSNTRTPALLPGMSVVVKIRVRKA